MAVLTYSLQNSAQEKKKFEVKFLTFSCHQATKNFIAMIEEIHPISVVQKSINIFTNQLLRYWSVGIVPY